MTTPSYRVRIRAGAPGDKVDLYVTATGERIGGGTIDANGDLDMEYPASYGPAHAVARDPSVGEPWQANHAYSHGDLVASPHFGGWMLRCALSGTSGSTEPTDANRMKGQVHRPIWGGRAFSGAGHEGGGSAGYYGYLNTNVDHDGDPTTWLDGTQVEGASSIYCAYMLMSDGTIKFAGPNNSGYYAATYAALALLPPIVKLYPYRYGITALDTSGNLHHITDYQDNIGWGSAIDTLLAANPTAVALFPGAKDGTYATLLLADGTAISNSATINTNLAGITDIDHGVHNHNGKVMVLCENGRRLRGTDKNGAFDDTGTWISDEGDHVDEMQSCYSMHSVAFRSGRRQRWITYGTYYNKHEMMISYLTGPPPDLYARTVDYGTSADGEGAYLYLPYSAIAVKPPSGTYHNLRLQADPLTERRLELGGHPIIRDAGCTWHLIKPQGNQSAPQIFPESFESAASTVPVGSVSGTLAVDQVPAERPVLALAYVNGEPAVLASGTSDINGAFELNMPGQIEPVYLLAMDNAGPTWSAGASVLGGDRVIPTAAGHTGLVYACSASGTTGITEPTWPAEIGGSVIDGTVTWDAIAYYQPQAHGPVQPIVLGTPDDIIENGATYAYSGQVTEGEGSGATILQAFANTIDAADLIYRRLAPPADIVDGDTWAYVRTIQTVHFWADEYANTLDADDIIGRLLDGTEVSTLLPLTLTVPNGGFEDQGDGWTVTMGSMSFLTTAHMGAYEGTTYTHGGPNAETRYNRDVDIATDCDLPVWALAGELTLRWHQASYSGNDKAQAILTFLDDQGGTLGTINSAMETMDPAQTWFQREISSAVPAGTVAVNVAMIIDRFAGTNNDGYIDAIQLRLTS